MHVDNGDGEKVVSSDFYVERSEVEKEEERRSSC